MSDTNPALDAPEAEHDAPTPDRTKDLGGDDVASAPALQPRDSGGGDLVS
jgi:hypothetical protein